ncbi:MAG: CRISPR-associated CARF protein Csa3, partial [Thermosphaera sp.]
MILIFTLGFDEKFALRTIFRRGIKVGDKIIVVMPEKNDPRAEKAYLMLQQIISNSIPGIPIEKITIPSQDFPRAVSLLRKIALSLLRKNGKIVLGLSGGQRIIILQLLAAFLSVGAREVEIEIESEDSSIVATFPLGMMMKVELDQDEIRILKS